jgi:hypothetical protein
MPPLARPSAQTLCRQRRRACAARGAARRRPLGATAAASAAGWGRAWRCFTATLSFCNAPQVLAPCWVSALAGGAGARQAQGAASVHDRPSAGPGKCSVALKNGLDGAQAQRCTANHYGHWACVSFTVVVRPSETGAGERELEIFKPKCPGTRPREGMGVRAVSEDRRAKSH